MRKILTVLILLALCASVTDLAAQRRGSDEEYFDESGGIGHRLWYGSHFSLGFNSNGFSSLFQFGLAPMVGFKINDIISIGPRASLLYYNYRVNYGGGNIDKAKTTSWAVGAFARVRPFPTWFAQLEYNLENEPIFNADLSVSRFERGSAYIGVGYNAGTGGPIAFEALLMYNVNQPGNSINSPLDYRIGITYKY